MLHEAGLCPCLRGIGGTTQQEQAQELGHSDGEMAWILDFIKKKKKHAINSACFEAIAFLAIVRMKAIGHIITPIPHCSIEPLH